MTDRYSRQTLFPPIGDAGQQRIGQSTLTIIGCGALGTVAAEMLARAGVGHLRLIDRDFVEESNLQRQSLFTEEDARLGMPKAVAAVKALRKINSQIQIESVVEDVSFANVERLCGGCDLVIDATDNFETRYLINDVSVKHSRPWIYGGCVGSYGVSAAFVPNKTPCLQCLFEEPPALGSLATCDTAGIISPAVHIVASFQVTQACKLMTGGTPRTGIFQFDVWQDEWRWLPLQKAQMKECSCCVQRRFRFLDGSETSRLTRLCGRDAVQVSPRRKANGASSTIDFEQLADRLSSSATVSFNQHIMRIAVGGYQINLFPDGRSIIKGTDDPSIARTVYSRYIGS